MKDYSIAWERNRMPAGESRPTAISNLDKNINNRDFSPAWNEIAKLAYFNYVNRGSKPGDDVEDWLAAEAQLLSEHNSRDSRGLCSEV
jgi:hypothetical protein